MARCHQDWQVCYADQLQGGANSAFWYWSAGVRCSIFPSVPTVPTEQHRAGSQVAYDQVKNAPSRGALTTDFLRSTLQPLQYLNSLEPEVPHNLLWSCLAHGALNTLDQH